MEEKEVDEMHERFVVASGGKIPNPSDVGVNKRTSFERVQKESTYAMTKMFLKEKKSIAAIVKERGMVESTIWSHVEKLAADGEITVEDIKHLEPESEWGDISSALYTAIEKHGSDRLKALYEETNEQYNYSLIRLARVEYQLEHGNEAF